MAIGHPESLLHGGFGHSNARHSDALNQQSERSDEKALLGLGRHKDRWTELFRLVHKEYPYCTMFGVHVADGVILCCENIQSSLSFGPEEPRLAVAPEFDEYWQMLQALCTRIGKGSLLELRFSQGHPVSARRAEGGRRFKRFLQRPA